MPDPTARRSFRILEALGVVSVVAVAAYFAARALHLQWDLKTYLAAAAAARQGLDPYVLADLTRAVGRTIAYPFLYPPIALVPFLALTALPTATAGAVWIALKLVLLAGIVVLWKRFLVSDATWFETALIALLASEASAVADLRAGNVAIVEAALLTLAFVCYLRGRRLAFAGLVVATACFKLTPAAFLLLLLVPAGSSRPRQRLFAGALIGLAALVFLPGLVGPAAHWRGFLASLPRDALVSGPNPSVMAWIEFHARARIFDDAARTRLVIALGLAYGALVLGASGLWLRDTWRSADPRRWVITAAALYLLLQPRPMSYGLVLGGVVLLALRPAFLKTPLERLAYASAVCAQGAALALRQPWQGPFLSFLPAFVLLAVWVLALFRTPAAFAESSELALAERGGAQASEARAR